MIDAFVKSRHTRLSGIVPPHNALKKKDSGHPALRFARNRWVQASRNDGELVSFDFLRVHQ